MTCANCSSINLLSSVIKNHRRWLHTHILMQKCRSILTRAFRAPNSYFVRKPVYLSIGDGDKSPNSTRLRCDLLKDICRADLLIYNRKRLTYSRTRAHYAIPRGCIASLPGHKNVTLIIHRFHSASLSKAGSSRKLYDFFFRASHSEIIPCLSCTLILRSTKWRISLTDATAKCSGKSVANAFSSDVISCFLSSPYLKITFDILYILRNTAKLIIILVLPPNYFFLIIFAKHLNVYMTILLITDLKFNCNRF